MEELITVGNDEPIALDTEILVWVLIPIVVIIYLTTVLRTNIMALIKEKPKKTPREIQEGHYLLRARRLREVGNLFDFSSFSRRRDFFCSKTNGVFTIKCVRGLLTLSLPCSQAVSVAL